MDTHPRAFLKPRKARPFVYHHPWVFSGAIARIDGQPSDGDTIDVHDAEGTFVARGIWNSQSQIQVRLYTWNAEEVLDRDFFARRIQQAIEFRQQLRSANALKPDEPFRLVNSDGDGLSGLILDVYPPFGVVQILALGLERRRKEILEILRERSGLLHLMERSDGPICAYEGLAARTGVLWGDKPPALLPIQENGFSFVVDLRRGHKTGYYLDQRENRRRAAELAIPGRVLDVFCYSGTLGIHAARPGGHILGIDESSHAVRLAVENAARNRPAEISTEYRKASAVPALWDLLGRGEQFDTVVLDPPKFAHSRHELERAFRGYLEINRLGLGLVRPGGRMISCSCSGALGATEFQAILHEAAYQSGRGVQILETRSQAVDHPVALACPETQYLKCFFLQVL